MLGFQAFQKESGQILGRARSVEFILSAIGQAEAAPICHDFAEVIRSQRLGLRITRWKQVDGVCHA